MRLFYLLGLLILPGLVAWGQGELEIKLKTSSSLKYWRAMELKSSDTTIDYDLDDITIPWERNKIVLADLPEGDYKLRFSSMFHDTLTEAIVIKQGHTTHAACPKRSYYQDVSTSQMVSQINMDTAKSVFHIVTKYGMRHGPQKYEKLHFTPGSEMVSYFSIEDSTQFQRCAPQDFWEALRKFEKRAKLNNKKFFIPRYNSDQVRFYRTTISFENKVADYWYTSDMRYLFTRVIEELLECVEDDQ